MEKFTRNKRKDFYFGCIGAYITRNKLTIIIQMVATVEFKKLFYKLLHQQIAWAHGSPSLRDGDKKEKWSQ